MTRMTTAISHLARGLLLAGLLALPATALRATCCYTGFYGEVCVTCVDLICLYSGPSAGSVEVISLSEGASAYDLCTLLNTPVK